MQVVLYEPEIPPNTGNIARLCAAFDIKLNLIGPLGFKLEDKYLKRAGLDYWPHVKLIFWSSWKEFFQSRGNSARLIMVTTKSSTILPDFYFEQEDLLIFGPETRGLPKEILEISPWHVRIPMINMNEGGVRSLNLSTACGIILYTALSNCNLLHSFK